jgi:hypothetical protein
VTNLSWNLVVLPMIITLSTTDSAYLVRPGGSQCGAAYEGLGQDRRHGTPPPGNAHRTALQDGTARAAPAAPRTKLGSTRRGHEHPTHMWFKTTWLGGGKIDGSFSTGSEFSVACNTTKRNSNHTPSQRQKLEIRPRGGGERVGHRARAERGLNTERRGKEVDVWGYKQ